MQRSFLAATLIGASLMVGACEHTVLYHQRTSLGIDAAASTTEAGGHLSIGYRRNFSAIVPDAPDSDESMSVVSCVSIAVLNAFQFEVSETMATGEAAENYARNLVGGTERPLECNDGVIGRDE